MFIKCGDDYVNVKSITALRPIDDCFVVWLQCGRHLTISVEDAVDLIDVLT